MGTKLDYRPRGWTEDEIAKVREMAMRGMSAAAISMQMHGRTRNAVLGVMHRNGWSGPSRSEKLAAGNAGVFRPTPAKRAMLSSQASHAVPVRSVSLAGPAWSWPRNVDRAAA
jgi:hypothetical protein